jgi:lipopolysaccharide/colanic/teichoic acid biosynthesis glycosyltransferase
MPVATDVNNTPLAARLSSLSGSSSYACVRASCVSDIMQYGFAAMSLVLLAPLFLIIGQLIRFTGQGPIFYRGCISAKMDAFLRSINSIPCRLALRRRSAAVC